MRSNYFLVYHSVLYKQDDTQLLLNDTDKDFDKISAFILSIPKERLDYFLEYDEFKKLSKKVIINGFLDSSTLYEFCYKVLKRIEKNLDLVAQYLKVFTHLASVGLMTNQQLDSLRTIFEALLVDVTPKEIKSMSFLDLKEQLNSLILEVRKNTDSIKLNEQLDSIDNYLSKKIFSIGITGVMNVGKSTFINALLQKELLGSSVVAETANLSILKYSKEPYAKVVFLNSLELEELIHTQDNFVGDKLDLKYYIQEKSLVLDVMQSELKRYTSATDSISDIVKNVELGVDLEFLKDSIEIVDTPGLDDTLIVRETITKSYVESCDLLIHLMNVNQSATQKDIDFLVENANNQNLSAILILLTKVDNISKDELDQVMTYTKRTILSQLNTKIPIEFLSISATTKVGMQDIKDYLHHTLFDSNIKNESIIYNSRLNLKNTIKQQIKEYEYMLLLYSKDEEALELELKEFNKLKEKNKISIQKLKTNIDSELKEYEKFINELDAGLESDLDLLKDKLLMRIIDEISYSFKNKVKVKERQLLMLIDKSISHGYIDVIREYKYKLKEQMLTISKKIELSFKEHNIKVDLSTDEESMSELFKKNSTSSLNTTIKMISKRVNILVTKLKSSKIQEFKDEFLKIINEEFVYVVKNINVAKDELNQETKKEFFSLLKEPIDKLKMELSQREELISSQIYKFKNSDEDLEVTKVKVQEKINSLNVVLRTLL